ncbi:MAG: conjugal transfer protein TraG, partial [Gammaproteobacteria bacterium]|nr:conjugal transfer protein TraG [Gammaproteobacteria bacterium]
MVVSSPLELYTVYLGWRQYDVIWQACSEFGLCWLPFIGLIFENMTVPFETPFGHGAETSLRRMIIQLFLMGIFLLLFAIPSNILRTADVRYKPYCADHAVESTVGDTGTTYDNVFQTAAITDVKVPILFGLAMDWSSGFTNALIRG